MAIYKVNSKGSKRQLNAREIKAEIMKNYGFKTTQEYNKAYDIMRNKMRAYERYMALQGKPVEKQSVAEFMYKQGKAMKKHGKDYNPSIKAQEIMSFSSVSSGKAGVKYLTGKRGEERAKIIIRNSTFRQFHGLIKANPTAKAIFDKYYNDPVKQLDELIRFANQLHADLGYRGKSGEAIFSGEVFGSDTYGEGWILDD